MPELVEYSVVVPVYNSRNSLSILIEEIDRVLASVSAKYEIILIDDDSNDDSWTVLKSLKPKFSNVKIIRLKPNVGQLTATQCGIEKSKGKAIITIDDDLQYPPKEIKKLIHYYKESRFKIVFGSPVERQHSERHNLMVKVVKFLFNYIIMPSYKEIRFFTTFRIFNRELFFDGETAKTGNLFFLWEIPAKEMGWIGVEHQERPFDHANYDFLKLSRYYRGQIVYGTSRILQFLILSFFLFFSVLFILRPDSTLMINLLNSVGLVVFFLILTCLFARLILKNIKKLSYKVDEYEF